MTPDEQETVRAFRRAAQDARRALTKLTEQADTRRVVDGYIEFERWLERYRRLCVPVRRMLIPHDKASFRQTSAILKGLDDAALRARAEQAVRSYDELMTQLERDTTLGGRRIKGTEMVKAWLDAAVFYDSTDRRKPYDDMLATMGKAVEGLAAEYTEELGHVMLVLDEIAASALGEPLVLPDPQPTKPPPPEPRGLRGWWIRRRRES
jgi:hypothetical protein